MNRRPETVFFQKFNYLLKTLGRFSYEVTPELEILRRSFMYRGPSNVIQRIGDLYFVFYIQKAVKKSSMKVSHEWN